MFDSRNKNYRLKWEDFAACGAGVFLLILTRFVPLLDDERVRVTAIYDVFALSLFLVCLNDRQTQWIYLAHAGIIIMFFLIARTAIISSNAENILLFRTPLGISITIINISFLLLLCLTLIVWLFNPKNKLIFPYIFLVGSVAVSHLLANIYILMYPGVHYFEPIEVLILVFQFYTFLIVFLFLWFALLTPLLRYQHNNANISVSALKMLPTQADSHKNDTKMNNEYIIHFDKNSYVIKELDNIDILNQKNLEKIDTINKIAKAKDIEIRIFRKFF